MRVAPLERKSETLMAELEVSNGSLQDQGVGLNKGLSRPARNHIHGPGQLIELSRNGGDCTSPLVIEDGPLTTIGLAVK